MKQIKHLLVILLVSGFMISNSIYGQEKTADGKAKIEKQEKKELKELKTTTKDLKSETKMSTKDIQAKKKALKDKYKNATPEEQEKIKKKLEELRVQGNGHAYGKNKNDLEGKAFGQARAKAVNAKLEAQELSLKKNKALLYDAESRLKAAKLRFEEAKKENTLNKTEIAEKELLIQKVERKLKELSNAIGKNKNLMHKYRKELSEMTKKN